MSRGINEVILIGYIGQPPDLRYTRNRKPVCEMRLATNETYTDEEGNEVTKTEWHDVVAWGRLAEICEEYLDKGSQIYVEGKLKTREWSDRDGTQRYSTEVIAREVRFLDSKEEAEKPGSQPERAT